MQRYGLVGLLLVVLLFSACTQLPLDGAPAAATATQRAPADSAAKQAALEATQAAETAALEKEQEETVNSSEVAATETAAAPEGASELESVPESTDAESEDKDVTWHAVAAPAGLFGGGVLFFCHAVEITRSEPPSDDVAAVLVQPEELEGSEVLALAEVHWPAASGELTDLDDLANAVFAQEQAALCAPEAYGDLWDGEAVSHLPEDVYLTGIARLVDGDAPYWVVRVGIVAEE